MFHNRRACCLLLLGVAAATPVILYGADRAWQRQGNRVEDWLPDTFPEVRELAWFADRFGGDEYLAISWQGCDLDDPRAPALAAALATARGGRASRRWFKRVVDGPTLLASLRDKPASMTEEDAAESLRGWLLGRDGRTTCVLALVSDAGAADRHAAIESVFSAADRVDGLAAGDLKLVGPTLDSVAIDRASRRSLAEFNYVSWAVCVGVLLASLRSVRLALVVFAAAWFAEMVSLAVMHYSGSHLDSILLLVANLTFVLVIAGGVHLIHYIAEAAGTGSPTPVAIARGWRTAAAPCLLAAVTTGLGMGSLMVSGLPPVRSFGGFAAVSVLIGAAIVLTLLPCTLAVLPPGRWPRRSAGGIPWGRLARAVSRRRGPVVGAACVLLAAGAVGCSWLETTASVHKLFRPESQVLRDRSWFRENLGELVPIEVVLRWPPIPADTEPRRQSAEFLRRMYVADQLGDELRSLPQVDATVDASSFVPPLPARTSRRLSAVAQRGVFGANAFEQRDRLIESGFYLPSEAEELWRVSTRVSRAADGGYDGFLAAVQRLVGRIAQGQDPAPNFVVCGGAPVVQKTQSQLLIDLAKSFGVAVGMIAVVMVAVQRSVRLGLLTLIPNLLPSVLVFGAFGWLGLEIEIGTVLTASVALGIAIDDSLHYLLRFRHAIRGGAPAADALRAAFGECGGAMVQTTLVLVLGLSVFMLSDFVPISRFAWVMMSLLGLALAADLLVLPALLCLTRNAQELRTMPGGNESTPR